MQTNQPKRVLAISLSSRGFGYACLEGKDRLVDYGNKACYEQFKNAWLFAKAEKLIGRNAPDILVLQDFSAKNKARSSRIRELHGKLIGLAKERKIKVLKLSRKQVYVTLLKDERATKHDMAQHLATLFPIELGLRVPPKRKAWMNQHPRIDLFDAVGMAITRKLELGAVHIHGH